MSAKMLSHWGAISSPQSTFAGPWSTSTTGGHSRFALELMSDSLRPRSFTLVRAVRERPEWPLTPGVLFRDVFVMPRLQNMTLFHQVAGWRYCTVTSTSKPFRSEHMPATSTEIAGTRHPDLPNIHIMCPSKAAQTARPIAWLYLSWCGVEVEVDIATRSDRRTDVEPDREQASNGMSATSTRRGNVFGPCLLVVSQVLRFAH